MTIKIVTFGQSDQVSRFVDKSGNQKLQKSQQSVVVENVTVAQVAFLLFAVKQKGLVSEQATGTNGLIFFLGSDTPLFEEKQYLTQLLNSRAQFDGIPVAVVFEKGQQLTLKDVVNYMELYRFKERASMIKEISWSERDWVEQVYSWIKTQSEQIKVKGFQAPPKVVKLKPKYRESTEEESQKKYQGMLGQKPLRGMAVKQQQQVYIQREKQRLKQQNMEKQLSNFSKNKKKMAPYDIKPTPNPKIQPNLHFFLKDPNAQPPPEASIKIQTDEFKQRVPPPPYKPKKTGINISTQIQQNELFSFDKQVKPILSILTTKALESAALQIEEEEELLKMSKYKTAYEERVRKQKDHQQKNIDEELRVMKQKDKLLQAHRNRAQTVKNIQQRTQCYQIAHNFLENIYIQSTQKLITANSYPNSLNNYLQSEFLSEIINKSSVYYQQIKQKQQIIHGVFEKDVLESITKVVKGPKEAREKAKKRLQARMTNKSTTTRRVHILYKHNYQQFSNFSKFLSKHFEGSLDQYVKSRQQQIQQASDKLQASQISQQEQLKIKHKDNVDFANMGHQCYLIQNKNQICFTRTSNRYEKASQNLITNKFVYLDTQGQIIDELTFGQGKSSESFLRVETGLRQARQAINMDEGFAINISKIPQNVKTIIVLLRFTEAQRYRLEAEAKKIKYSSYGVQFWQRKIGIHQKNIGESLKWQEIIKVQEGQQPASQSIFVVSYILRRRVIPQYWNLQDISYVSNPIKSDQQMNHFFEQLSRFYIKSNQFLKQQEEDQKIERPVNSQEKSSSGNQRAKSKKAIQEPKKKIVLKITTKILKEVQINLNDQFQTSFKKLEAVVEQWKEFLASCQNGWQILIKGKKLTSVSQLVAFKKIGDLVLKKIPKVQQPKIEKVQEVEESKQQAEQ